jgi:plasmid stability protein
MASICYMDFVMNALNLPEVDDEIVQKLEERARRNGRSREAEHRAILRRVLFWDTPDAADSETMSWEERAARLRKLTARRQHTPSEVLIREDRDSR